MLPGRDPGPSPAEGTAGSLPPSRRAKPCLDFSGYPRLSSPPPPPKLCRHPGEARPLPKSARKDGGGKKGGRSGRAPPSLAEICPSAALDPAALLSSGSPHITGMGGGQNPAEDDGGFCNAFFHGEPGWMGPSRRRLTPNQK